MTVTKLGLSIALKPLSSCPIRFVGWHEPNRNPFDESLHPLAQIFHAGLFRHDVSHHNQALRNAQRGGVGDVLDVIEESVDFLYQN